MKTTLLAITLCLTITNTSVAQEGDGPSPSLETVCQRDTTDTSPYRNNDRCISYWLKKQYELELAKFCRGFKSMAECIQDIKEHKNEQ